MAIGLALLASPVASTVNLFSHALREVSLSLDSCREAQTAIRLLKRRKFDAVIVDLQLGEQSTSILDEVRLSLSNRKAVTFAVSSGDAALFNHKPDFIFERPLSTESIWRILKPAYGMILRERRRYFRCPVAIPVTIQRQSMQEVRCCSINISEGGIALSTFVPFIPGEGVRVQFNLPEHAAPIVAQSEICWWKTGHLGVRFISVSDEHKSELQVWLSGKLEEALPEFVAGQFHKAERSLMS